MTAPEITAALEALIASTPPPVTVWGVRYTQSIFGLPARYIDWCATEDDAREWLAHEQAVGCRVELVRITGRVHTTEEN